MSKHRFAILALAAIFFSGSSAALIQNAVATAPVASAHDDKHKHDRDDRFHPRNRGQIISHQRDLRNDARQAERRRIARLHEQQRLAAIRAQRAHH